MPDNKSDWNKVKASLIYGEKSEKENVFECFAIWLKVSIYAVTNIDVEISMNILKGIQQAGFIIEMMI